MEKILAMLAPASIRLELIGFLSALLIGLYLLIAPYAFAGELSPISAENASEKSPTISKVDDPGIWLTDVGKGFRPGTQVLGIGAGATYGLLMLGGDERHHLVLGSLSYGRMIGGLKGDGRWYSGNWELWLELFGGGQVDSKAAYIIGLAPHLRYHFSTGTRWIPFIDAGFGISLTNIGGPDLGDVFQFTTQAGAGVHWFIKDDLAIVFEGRYLHISSAGLSMPNDGVNTAGILMGIKWFF